MNEELKEKWAIVERLGLSGIVYVSEDGKYHLPTFRDVRDGERAKNALNEIVNNGASGTPVAPGNPNESFNNLVLMDLARLPISRQQEFVEKIREIHGRNQTVIDGEREFTQLLAERLQNETGLKFEISPINSSLLSLVDQDEFRSATINEEIIREINAIPRHKDVRYENPVMGGSTAGTGNTSGGYAVPDPGASQNSHSNALYFSINPTKEQVQAKGEEQLFSQYASIIKKGREKEQALVDKLENTFGIIEPETGKHLFLDRYFDSQRDASSVAAKMGQQGLQVVEEEGRWRIRVNDIGRLSNTEIDAGLKEADRIQAIREEQRKTFGKNLGNHQIVAFENGRDGYYYRFKDNFTSRELAEKMGGEYINSGLLKVFETQDGQFFLGLNASKLNENVVDQMSLGQQITAENVNQQQQAQTEFNTFNNNINAAASLEGNKITVTTALRYESEREAFLKAFSEGAPQGFATAEVKEGQYIVTLDLSNKPENFVARTQAANQVLNIALERVNSARNQLTVEPATNDGVVVTSAPMGEQYANALRDAINGINVQAGGQSMATVKQLGNNFHTVMDPSLIAPGIEAQSLQEMQESIRANFANDKQAKEQAAEVERQRLETEALAKTTRQNQLAQVFGALTEQDGKLLLPQVLHNKEKAEAIVQAWGVKDPNAKDALSVVEIEENGQKTYRVGVDRNKILQVEVMKTSGNDQAQPTEAVKEAKEALDGEVAAFKQRLEDLRIEAENTKVQVKQEEERKRREKEDEEKRKNSRNSMLNWSIPLVVGVAAVLLLGGGGLSLLGIGGGLAIAGVASLITQNMTGTGLFAPKTDAPADQANPAAASETAQPGANVSRAHEQATAVRTDGVVPTADGAPIAAVPNDVTRQVDPGPGVGAPY